MNWLHIIFMCEIYVILALGANLISGYTGLLSFANAALYGVGTYVTALAMKNLNLNYLLSFFIAIGFNLFVSLIITYFSIRLKDLYFTLATLAFQIIVYNILYNWMSVTGGSLGVSEIPRATVFGYRLNTTGNYAALGGVFSIIVITFFFFFQKSPLARLLGCIRDRQLAAISLGKNISYYKLICNSIGGIVITISGSLYAVYSSYIDPRSFDLNESILIVNIILIGGTGNLKGPILGAIFFVLLPEAIRKIPITSYQGASLQMMLYGLMLIVIIRFRPNGFFGKFKF